jgi:hypothetical protein
MPLVVDAAFDDGFTPIEVLRLCDCTPLPSFESIQLALRMEGGTDPIHTQITARVDSYHPLTYDLLIEDPAEETVYQPEEELLYTLRQGSDTPRAR